MGLKQSLSFREVVIGLDVTDGLVTAARLASGRDGELRLVEVAWTEVPVDASDDTLAEAIRHMWRRHRLSSVSVAASIRNRSLSLKLFHYPGLRREELDGALLLEAEETLQLPPDEIVADWHVNHRAAADGKPTSEIEGVSVALARVQVDRHMALLKAAGLFPVVVDIPCLALANLFHACRAQETADEVVCVVSVASQCADIAVLSNDGGVYPRSVFERPNVPGGAINYFVDCVKDVLAYYQFKLRLPAVDRVLVTGGCADAMADALRSAIEVPVALWDPCVALNCHGARVQRLLRQAPENLTARLACTLGLALRSD